MTKTAGPVERAQQQGPKRGKFAQTGDGRTKKAYDAQPALLPWKCAICIGERRKEMLDEEKGRDHLTAKEINEVSFGSSAELELHYRQQHDGTPVQFMGQGTKTTSVLRREKKFRAAVMP